MSAVLNFHADPARLKEAGSLLVMGRRHLLLTDEVRRHLPANVSPEVWTSMVGTGTTTDDGQTATTWLAGRPDRLTLGVLPDVCSRHNTPSRAWAVPHLLTPVRHGSRLGVLLAAEAPEHALALALGVARGLPTYHANPTTHERVIDVAFAAPIGHSTEQLAAACAAVRRAAHLVDAPPAELGPQAMLEEATAVATRTGSRLITIVGDQLRQQGLGGLWGVGKAASEPPALVVLDHDPAGARRHDAWIGKGILFDTGGLSLKDKSSMPGMKTDMAGAAAVLCAFEAAVRLGHSERLTAVLCLAENAIGPAATRPDDILRLYSGRSVEINNTDAEGRLVLADGIAWVRKHRSPGRIIDLATLTGAQAVATGKRHAAVISNDPTLEAALVEQGLRTGDLVFPLPFCPEFFRREFTSRVADFKNSVKDRNNAQASCAAEFLHMNLPDDDVPWAHVDMAAPAHHGDRGTGFGVGLLLGQIGVV